MDVLAELRKRIAAYPGYAGLDGRRLSDELVRSYAGEALARVKAGTANLDPQDSELLNDLLFRAGFVNQAAFAACETATAGAEATQRLEAADLALIELADRAGEWANINAGLQEMRGAFDRRDRAMAACA